MNNFFSQYTGFDYSPTNAPEFEFERLRAVRLWKKGTKNYKKHRRAFFSALLTVTKSPVHRFFTEMYYFPSYNPTANPKREFDRLAEARKWKPTKRAVLEFFEEYEEEGFDYNPRGNPEIELDRLAWFKEWKYRTPEWRVALDTFHQAIKADFNTTFGRNDDDIEGWQFLCHVLGVRDVEPATAIECREVLKDKHCNIYDLLNEPRKVYPAEEADRGALKFVLRKIAKYELLKRPDNEDGQDNGGEQVETEVQDNKKKRRRKRKLRHQVEEQADPAP
ncbi:hypothetical protein BDD12DRAFT_907978 [Trichophaea hybrida]|nr:hypothetical protein BDD12DRAFT_907978 [Trichophaea hybrida]